MIDKLIRKLIIIKYDEESYISRWVNNSFNELIVNLNIINYGLRLHTYERECNCQPEYKIKQLLDDEELKDFLEGQKVLEIIQKVLDEPINTDKTIWERYKG